MNKSLGDSKNIDAINLTKRYKLAAEANIVIGTPGETEEDFRRTIIFLKKSRPDRIDLAKFFPLPGSHDYTNLSRKGVLKGEYENWDEIYERYVGADFTFTAIPAERFRWLLNKMNREIYLYTNYLFELKNNIHRDARIVAKKFIFIFLHVGFLYLPLLLQDKFKKTIARLSYSMRYLFYDAATK